MFFNFFARFKSPLLECRLKMATKLLLRSCPFSVLKVDWAEPAGLGSINFPAGLVSWSTIKKLTRIVEVSLILITKLVRQSKGKSDENVYFKQRMRTKRER